VVISWRTGETIQRLSRRTPPNFPAPSPLAYALLTDRSRRITTAGDLKPPLGCLFATRRRITGTVSVSSEYWLDRSPPARPARKVDEDQTFLRTPSEPSLWEHKIVIYYWDFPELDAAVRRGFIACFIFPRTLGDKCFARLAILPRCEPVPAHRATLRYSGFVGANQSSPIPRASAKYSQYPRSFRHESHRRAVSVSDENVLRRSSEGYSWWQHNLMRTDTYCEPPPPVW